VYLKVEHVGECLRLTSSPTVRLGLHTSYTDESGTAKVSLPKDKSYSL
jgi:hypothetical protein